jgi:hypothetical protein
VRRSSSIRGATLPRKVVKAFRSAGASAGATEEMIAGACLILGSFPSGPVGRPRNYKNRAEPDRAYKLRKKEREKTRISTPECEETRISTHALSLDEIKAIHATPDPVGRAAVPQLAGWKPLQHQAINDPVP